ncbi:MAG: hypothetical protein ACTSP4_07875, partial [Candidatus Hodarchaeales archaeon]
QRGFEIDLKNSMNFSLPFFTSLADSIPSINSEKLTAALQKIAKMVVLVLKDLFVNTELVRRGFAPQLCEYYENLLEYKNPDSELAAPVFDIKYTPGKALEEEELDEFVEAMNFMLSLLPTWLPLTKDRKAGYLGRGLDLKHYLYDVFQKNLHVMSSEFHAIEDIYLTNFAFTREFHLEFYTRVFTFILKYLSGENFDLQSINDAVQIINQTDLIPAGEKGAIILPLLKAGDLISETSKVQEIYKTQLKELMEHSMSATDLKEWAADKADYKPGGLMVMPLYLMLMYTRQATVDGVKRFKLLDLVRAALLLLQEMDLKTMTCYQPIRLLLKEYISERDSFSQIKTIYKAELIAKGEIFSDYPLKPEQIRKVLDQLDIFYVPITNDVLRTTEQLFQLYEASLSKSESDEIDPEVFTLTFSVAFSDVKDSTKEHAVPIVRTVLLINDVKTSLIRKITDKFGSFMASLIDEQAE